MLLHPILTYITLCCITLCCITLCYITSCYTTLHYVTLSQVTSVMLQYTTFPSHCNTLQYVKFSYIPLSMLPSIIFSVMLPYLIPHFPSLYYNTLSYVVLCCIAFHTITLLTLSHVTYPIFHCFIQPYLKLHSLMLS